MGCIVLHIFTSSCLRSNRLLGKPNLDFIDLDSKPSVRVSSSTPDELSSEIRTDLIITGIYQCNTTDRCQLSVFTFIWLVTSRLLSSRHLSIDLSSRYLSINPRMVASFHCTKFPSLRYRVGLLSKPIVIRVTNLSHDGVNPNLRVRTIRHYRV